MATVGSATLDLHPSGPRAWSPADANSWAQAVTDALSTGSGTWVNAKNSGVKGDGVTDDSAALQAVIDANPGGIIYLPAGTYICNTPIRLRQRGTRVVGAGKLATTLKRTGAYSGWLGVISPVPVAFPAVASLASGAGSAMNFSSADGDWLNLTADSNYGVSLNTRSIFTIRFFYKPTGPLAEIRTLCSAANKRTSAESTHTSLSLIVLADGSMQAQVNVAGSLKTINTAAGVIVAGVTSHIALCYDNTKIRLFVAGVNVGEVAATGAVDMPVLDQLIFGPFNWNLFSCTKIFTGPRGVIDSISVEGYAYYTANFTPPTAKHVSGFATLALINFDNISEIFIDGVSALAGAKTTKYLWHSDSDPTVFGSGGGDHCGFEDLEFDGGGVYCRASVELRFKRLQFIHAPTSLVLTNNCFQSRMEDLECTGVGSNSVNFVNTSASGVNVWDNISSESCSYALWIENSGVELNNLFLFASTKVPLVLQGNNGSTMNAIVKYADITDEAQIGTETMVLADAGVMMSFDGCTFEAISNAIPLMKLAGDKPVVLNSCTFTAKTGSTERITFLGVRTVPVVVYEPAGSPSDDATIPWCASAPSMVVLYKLGKQYNTKGISGTEVAANNLRGSVTVSNAATTGTVTFTTTEADNAYYLAVTPVSSTGSPAAGANRVKSVAKSASNFVITLEAAPGAGTSVTFDWMLLR